MSPLDPDKIAQLLAKKSAPRSKSSTGKTGKGKHDPNDRSYKAWFALNHLLLDEETHTELLYCDNPDCIDPRDKEHGQVVVLVSDKHMCRFCFIEGWLKEQLSVPC